MTAQSSPADESPQVVPTAPAGDAASPVANSGKVTPTVTAIPQTPPNPPRRPIPPRPVPQNPFGNIPDAATASLYQQFMNMQRAPSQKFLLIVVPEDDWPRCEIFDDMQEQIKRIKELRGTPSHVFPLMGHRFTITQGPYPFLKTPMGPIPLFDVDDPDSSEEVEHGWVGEARDRPMIPTSERPPLPPSSELSSEGNPDEDSEGAGVTSPHTSQDTPVF